MAQLNWPKDHDAADEYRRVVVVPQTPDYDHPYARRVPTPPQRNRATPKATILAPPPARRSNPAKMGLALAVGAILAICGAAYFVMTSDHAPTREEKLAVSNRLAANAAEATVVETPADYLSVIDVTSVRLAGDQTRAVIDGKVYKVGDVINEHHGLKLVGHDPDGEYLLFRDNQEQTHLLSLYKAE